MVYIVYNVGLLYHKYEVVTPFCDSSIQTYCCDKYKYVMKIIVMILLQNLISTVIKIEEYIS